MSLVTMYAIGSVVRYGSGITALMKITSCDYDAAGPGSHRYYGRQFFGGTVGAYHSDLRDARPAELHLWEQNEKADALILGARVAINAINDALNNLPAKGECAKHLKIALAAVQHAVSEAHS